MRELGSSLHRCSSLGQFRRRLPRGESALHEVDSFVELLEILSKVMDSRVVGDDRTPAFYSLRERRGNRTEDSDEYPAGDGKATKVNYAEFVHDSTPLRR